MAEEEIITISKEEVIKKKNIPLKKLLPANFYSNADKSFKYYKKFCSGIQSNLKEENYEIMAITGYAGTGKSQLGAITGTLIDEKYSFGKNINFLPTSNQIERDYLKLPMYSYLHIDEASRSIHKHKWFEKTQQKLSQLYDTERENHFLASCLIMPRFQNFTENFRNFFIKYWINIPIRGLAIVYRRDEDKDTKDPWNVDDNFKLKQKYWKGKRIFERTIQDIIRVEQKTKNYWFYFLIPEIPKDVWQVYKYLKKESRVQAKEDTEIQQESYKEKLMRERTELRNNIHDLLNRGFNKEQIAVKLGMSSNTVSRYVKEIKAVQSLDKSPSPKKDTINNIYNLNIEDKS